jgi:hypothetical protein
VKIKPALWSVFFCPLLLTRKKMHAIGLPNFSCHSDGYDDVVLLLKIFRLMVITLALGGSAVTKLNL